MNGVGVQGGSPPEAQREQIAALMKFTKHVQALRDWEKREFARLASRFDPLADVPLSVWQQTLAARPRSIAGMRSRVSTGLELPRSLKE